MNFKGTKTRWILINGWSKEGKGNFFPSVVLHGADDDGSLGRNRIVINVSHDQKIESIMANAKLISNALEILCKLEEARQTIATLKRSMLVHPDCEEGSEFDDLTSSAQEIEDEIESLIKDTTENIYNEDV